MIASSLAWLINALGVMGVPSAHPLIIEALYSLQQLQQSDGRWASEDGEWQDAHTTVESIRAIQQFSTLSGSDFACLSSLQNGGA